MAVSDDYLAYVLDQLGGVGVVQARRMFGGAGIYCRGVMFALVADDVLYLKEKGGNAVEMSYYEAPADILEDRDLLASWAQKALDIAVRKKRKSR